MNVEPNGLNSDEAKTGLEKDGPNAMPDTFARPLRSVLIKFWAPVPSSLEAAVIAGLLVFNATLAWFQEGLALDSIKIPVLAPLGTS